MSQHILYHGTSTEHLESILKNGLLPPGKDRPVNWTDHPSKVRDFVYLSRWMPTLYASKATNNGSNKHQLAIVACKVYEREMYPDEDFLVEAIARQQHLNRDSLYAVIKPNKFKKHGLDSLRHLGSVAVRQVPVKRILGHVTFKWDMELWGALGGDVSVSSIAHKILGTHYNERLQILFREGVEGVLAAHRRECELTPSGASVPPAIVEALMKP